MVKWSLASGDTLRDSYGHVQHMNQVFSAWNSPSGGHWTRDSRGYDVTAGLYHRGWGGGENFWLCTIAPDCLMSPD